VPASAYEKAAAVCLGDGFSDHQKVISKMHLNGQLPVSERGTEAPRQNSPSTTLGGPLVSPGFAGRAGCGLLLKTSLEGRVRPGICM
jgi:hypothetical protein